MGSGNVYAHSYPDDNALTDAYTYADANTYANAYTNGHPAPTLAPAITVSMPLEAG